MKRLSLSNMLFATVALALYGAGYVHGLYRGAVDSRYTTVSDIAHGRPELLAWWAQLPTVDYYVAILALLALGGLLYLAARRSIPAHVPAG
jgi:hypothetical protein